MKTLPLLLSVGWFLTWTYVERTQTTCDANKAAYNEYSGKMESPPDIFSVSCSTTVSTARTKMFPTEKEAKKFMAGCPSEMWGVSGVCVDWKLFKEVL